MHQKRGTKCIGAMAALGVAMSMLVHVGLVSLAQLVLSSTAQADRFAYDSRTESPRGVALGSGSRATATSTQAQADNAANLVLGGMYQIESFLAYDPTFKRFGWGGSVVDSMTSRVAAGFSLRTLFGSNDAGKNSGWDGRIGLAYPIIEQLSVGISMRYANMHIADPGAVPETPPMMDEMPDRLFRLKGFTMDAALTLRPLPGLSIAALGYNLVDRKSLLAPLMVGGSAGFGASGFTIGGDVLVDLNKLELFDGPKLRVGGGLEYLAGGAVPLRIGYQYDGARGQHAMTGGIGFADPRFGLLASLRQYMNIEKESMLFFAAQYFVK